MNAKEFEVVFYAQMSEWVSGGKVGPDPRGEWECRDPKEHIWDGEGVTTPYFATGLEYRWKQPKKRTVTIDGVELVAPEVDAPANGADYYVESWDGEVMQPVWSVDLTDRRMLANGKVFLTHKDCQAMAAFQRKQRLGQKSKPVVTDEMVIRFLSWSLPKDFAPDCGISFDGRKDENWCWNKTWPVGTNLLTADQAKAMLEHVIGGAS